MKIEIIGSGNLATQLGYAIQRSGHEIVQVYSRTSEHAEALGERLHCQWTDDLASVSDTAEVYILSVKDDALPCLITSLAGQLSSLSTKLFLHTAGSVAMGVFEGMVPNYGVLYPMQTFTKSRDVDFVEIPIFIEGNNPLSAKRTELLAKSLSSTVVFCDSERRKYLHLAAVFACNMTNHCYRLCEQILDVQGLDFRLFLPLINETAKKVNELSPKEAQTGPMVRYDRSVMDMQLELIQRPLTKEIYSLMAKSIHEDATHQK